MSAMRPPLTFVQDVQEDPNTGELRQSCSSPDSIKGVIAGYLLKLQRLPFFRWFLRNPLVLRQQDPSVKQKTDGRK
jgi:hypothetical protein